MAIQSLDKEINGSIYTVTQFPARRALKIKAKLIKIFGPIFAQVFLSIDTKKADKDQKNDFIIAIEMLSNTLDPNEFENLIVELLQSSRKSGMELTTAIIDLEFAGDMSSLYKLIWFVIEVNFADFFALMGIGHLFEQHPESKQDKAEITKKTFVKR
jgi:hypothetical protein